MRCSDSSVIVGNMKKILAKTLTGSRLYGTHHDQSDWDYSIIHLDPTRTGHRKYDNQSQKFQGDDDNQRRSLHSFVMSCYKGSPNDLDTLFSPLWEFYAPEWRPFFQSIRPNYVSATHRFKSFMKVYSENESNQWKSTRHMFRLGLNGYKLQTTGFYNPQLTAQELSFLEETTEKYLHASPDEKMERAISLMDTNHL